MSDCIQNCDILKNLAHSLLKEAERGCARKKEIDKLLNYPEINSDYNQLAALQKEQLPLLQLSSGADAVRLALELCELEGPKEMLLEELSKSVRALAVLARKANGEFLVVLTAKSGAERFLDYLTDEYLVFLNAYKTTAMQINEGTKADRRVFSVSGNDMSFECGEHRVCDNDGSGSVFVAIAPYVKTKENTFSEKDVKIEVFHSSGAGGQNVNKVETAVRALHLPTGITTVCQDERSQLQNKICALDNLKDKVKEFYKIEKQKELDSFILKAQTDNKIVRNYNLKTNTASNCSFREGIAVSTLEKGWLNYLI